MILTTAPTCLLGYATRDFVNLGSYKTNDIYKYLFTREDNLLLLSGAIKLIPFSMCNLTVKQDCVLAGKDRKLGDKLNAKDFHEDVLKTLIKNNIVECVIKDEFLNKDTNFIVKNAKLYDCVDKTPKEVAEMLDIDFKVLKEQLGLKQGANNKKINLKDLEIIKKIITGV